MYLDTMQQVLENTSKVIIDQKSGSNLLYLPLDKLIQGAAQSGAQAIPPARSDATTDPAQNQVQRSREAFRSREREAR
jgi:membrane protease subunit HflK